MQAWIRVRETAGGAPPFGNLQRRQLAPKFLECALDRDEVLAHVPDSPARRKRTRARCPRRRRRGHLPAARGLAPLVLPGAEPLLRVGVSYVGVNALRYDPYPPDPAASPVWYCYLDGGREPIVTRPRCIGSVELRTIPSNPHEDANR